MSVRRGGRPSKVDPRKTTVGFKVNQAEYRYLWALAQRQRCSIGEVVRSMALAGMAAAPSAGEKGAG